uniref:MICOS complex subunit MIC60 n=1 Tax=Ciona savignyi TaxID=51511 RepID=H2Y9N4_CIOSA
MLEGELPLSGIVVAEPPPPQPSEDEVRSKIKEEVMSESNRQLQLKLDQSAVEFNNKLKEKEREYEQEMRSKLRRQASAHAEQLAEALAYMEGQAAHKYQRIFDTKLSEQEHNHLLQMEEQRASHEEQTSRLSEEFQSSLNVAHSIVAGIQSALHGRAETENESRKAQELSLACDGLLFSLKYGDSGSPTPLSKDVECVRKVYRDNDAIEIISSSIPHEAIERGVYTEEVLRSAFSRISKICRRVSMVDQNRNSLFIYFLSYLKSLLTISTAQLAPPSDIDAGKLTPYTIIAFANHCVQRGDLEQAARFVNQLTGESRKVAEGWLIEVRLFLETRQAVEALSVLSNSIVIGSQLQ